MAGEPLPGVRQCVWQNDEYGREKNVVQSGAIQTISEAPAASHTLHVSVCNMRTKCESLSVCAAEISESVGISGSLILLLDSMS